MADDDIISGEIQDLLDLDEGLSEWEVEFVESIYQTFEIREFGLTDRQIEKVHDLWDRHCQ